MANYLRHALVHRLGRPAVHVPGSPPAPRPKRRWFRWLGRGLAILLVLGLLGGALLVLYAQALVRDSLPPLSGEVRADGLTDRVRVERDAVGIPTIRARNRTDVAFATGFVHAQDRFFQMDLMRRHAAGTLAELLGPGAVGMDRASRVHDFRSVARRVLETASPAHRALVTAYARGVEAGRKTLRRPPFEYLLLRTRPAPWAAEDTVLVALGMFRILQESAGEHEAARGLLCDVLPAPLADFLSPPGTAWDAPLDGSALAVPPVPGPDVIDLRKRRQLRPQLPVAAQTWVGPDGPIHGSNNWAVSGKHTAHGGALVANDMHLMLSVPGIWYRARLVWPAGGPGGGENQLTGATLPGAPALVVGSNTHIAWGFTNTEGDWSDLVVLDRAPGDPDRYRTPDGARHFSRRQEVIKVKGGPDVRMEVEGTVWGPVVRRDHHGRRLALRWVAHEPDAINFRLIDLETARTAAGAVAVAQRAGVPGMNFVVGDERGHIAWTVAGRIPRRVGFDGTRPVSWADGQRGWDGWVRPDEYPTIIDPPSGRLWTANNRVVGGAGLARIGLGGYDLGARARQIRDRLLAADQFTEDDMLAIQLDDRALFLRRWQQLLLEVLGPRAVEADPRRGPLRDRVAHWGGRAAPESVGFRIVRNFRRRVHDGVLTALTWRCRKADRWFGIHTLSWTAEGAVWRLVSERPAHLVPPGHATWEEFLLRAADAIRAEAEGKSPGPEEGLRHYTWGTQNTVRFRHVFSEESALLRWWLDLDMPPQQLPGDWSHMPRIQTPSDGASQRMAVAPGHEERGYFHMPAGQSGHPLSPHYRDGHAAWSGGEPTPFLPGPAVNVLVLVPGG